MVWQAYTLAFYGKRATGALRTIFVFMHQEMLEARDRLDEGRAVKEKIAPCCWVRDKMVQAATESSSRLAQLQSEFILLTQKQ
jgi:hypothetical protein